MARSRRPSAAQRAAEKAEALASARRAVRICTWASLVTAALGILLLALPKLLPVGSPWVQLALGALTLILSFRARAIGMRGVEGFDGRMSLLGALAGFAIMFFAGQAAFAVLSAVAS
ncbi:hypothetical protein [Microbacterium azadirachtae]|uniref:Uncharacterized protein n=1 Tax=Microbacterium azadirachtae TaxID=582680 RepID=A0A0F0LS45_9MICO|nr:hypothetical protein [Microbacterium azadirachtae]KJL34321.1 hypothetical protein RS86_01108 [Microbacterium azadirachtae]